MRTVNIHWFWLKHQSSFNRKVGPLSDTKVHATKYIISLALRLIMMFKNIPQKHRKKIKKINLHRLGYICFTSCMIYTLFCIQPQDITVLPYSIHIAETISCLEVGLGVSIPACHAGDWGSIHRRGSNFLRLKTGAKFIFCW